MRSGFSLIEILLVLALMAIASTVVILNFNAFSERDNGPNAFENLKQAVRQARFLAAKERLETQLSFDPESGSLVINREASVLERLQLDPSFKGRGGSEIRFYAIPSSKGLLDPADGSDAKTKIERVRFAPDGSSTPFVAEIDYGRGTPARFDFDPFSNLIKEVK